MISRRDFVKSALALGAGGLGGCSRFSPPTAPPPAQYRLRTVTYNVQYGKGWSREEYVQGDLDKPAPSHQLALMAAALASALRPLDAHIITFQESPDEWVIQRIAARLGMNYVFFQSAGAWPGALLTRFAILEASNGQIDYGRGRKELMSRHWGRAVLQSPDGPLVIHSLHLEAFEDKIRSGEVAQICAALPADLASGRPLIVQGDFNHPPIAEEYKSWKALGLIDAFEKAGNGAKQSYPSDLPMVRIDYIWVSPNLAGRLLDVRVMAEAPFLANILKPGEKALSDHLPVMASFA